MFFISSSCLQIGIKYNAEKEEKAKDDAKQKKLQQIEDAKKMEAEKSQYMCTYILVVLNLTVNNYEIDQWLVMLNIEINFDVII